MTTTCQTASPAAPPSAIIRWTTSATVAPTASLPTPPPWTSSPWTPWDRGGTSCHPFRHPTRQPPWAPQPPKQPDCPYTTGGERSQTLQLWDILDAILATAFQIELGREFAPQEFVDGRCERSFRTSEDFAERWNWQYQNLWSKWRCQCRKGRRLDWKIMNYCIPK